MKAISLGYLFKEGRFYLALFPHVVLLWLVLFGDAKYLFVLCVFFAEMVIDLIMILLVSLSYSEKVLQNIYKSSSSKLFLVGRSSLLGLTVTICMGLCIVALNSVSPFFVGVERATLGQVLISNTFFLAVTVFALSSIIRTMIGIYQYKTGVKQYMYTGHTFITNIFALFYYIVVGGVLLIVTNFHPIAELISIAVLIVLRAWIDVVLTMHKETIVQNFKKQHTQ